MAVDVIRDLRAGSRRTNIVGAPFWITSDTMDAAGTTIDDKVVIIFSFPVAGQQIILMQFVTEVLTNFTAGSSATIGYYSLATDAVTVGGVATLVDVDKVEASGATYTTAAIYYSATGDALAKKILGIPTAANDLIIGAATTVPAICATFGNAGTISGGKCRYHALIAVVPGTY
jgi:hypothetical protein